VPYTYFSKMEQLKFYKYQGTGNDFIMIDNRDLGFTPNQELIEELCDRQFGIGADGLILLQNDPQYHFNMRYFNADGGESSMCGNGGRCIVAFAHFLGVFTDQCQFTAPDGLHDAQMIGDKVKLKMIDVAEILNHADDYILNTGSPHYVRFIDQLEDVDVFTQGAAIRYSDIFPDGINVNFVQAMRGNEIFVRTYERGVEDETLSCGTGVTASSLCYMLKEELNEVDVMVLGGVLKVSANRQGNTFNNIWLQGPAVQVFSGLYNY
jgi:diaminopimelate epimerase